MANELDRGSGGGGDTDDRRRRQQREQADDAEAAASADDASAAGGASSQTTTATRGRDGGGTPPDQESRGGAASDTGSDSSRSTTATRGSSGGDAGSTSEPSSGSSSRTTTPTQGSTGGDGGPADDPGGGSDGSPNTTTPTRSGPSEDTTSTSDGSPSGSSSRTTTPTPGPGSDAGDGGTGQESGQDAPPSTGNGDAGSEPSGGGSGGDRPPSRGSDQQPQRDLEQGPEDTTEINLGTVEARTEEEAKAKIVERIRRQTGVQLARADVTISDDGRVQLRSAAREKLAADRLSARRERTYTARDVEATDSGVALVGEARREAAADQLAEDLPGDPNLGPEDVTERTQAPEGGFVDPDVESPADVETETVFTLSDRGRAEVAAVDTDGRGDGPGSRGPSPDAVGSIPAGETAVESDGDLQRARQAGSPSERTILDEAFGEAGERLREIESDVFGQGTGTQEEFLSNLTEDVPLTGTAGAVATRTAPAAGVGTAGAVTVGGSLVLAGAQLGQAGRSRLQEQFPESFAPQEEAIAGTSYAYTEESGIGGSAEPVLDIELLGGGAGVADQSELEVPESREQFRSELDPTEEQTLPSELPIQEPATDRPELLVSDDPQVGRVSPDELAVPEESLGDQPEIEVPVLSTQQQLGRQRERGRRDTGRSTQVGRRRQRRREPEPVVPEEFLPDEEVTIGEQIREEQPGGFGRTRFPGGSQINQRREFLDPEGRRVVLPPRLSRAVETTELSRDTARERRRTSFERRIDRQPDSAGPALRERQRQLADEQLLPATDFLERAQGREVTTATSTQQSVQQSQQVAVSPAFSQQQAAAEQNATPGLSPAPQFESRLARERQTVRPAGPAFGFEPGDRLPETPPRARSRFQTPPGQREQLAAANPVAGPTALLTGGLGNVPAGSERDADEPVFDPLGGPPEAPDLDRRDDPRSDTGLAAEPVDPVGRDLFDDALPTGDAFDGSGPGLESAFDAGGGLFGDALPAGGSSSDDDPEFDVTGGGGGL